MLHCIFGRILRSKVHCELCHTNTNTYDTFLDLSLEVHRSVTVPEVLRSFKNTDVLDGDNKFECSKCGKKTCATESLALHRTPRALQLYMKRFGISEGGGNTKIGHHVTFLELLKRMVQDGRSQGGWFKMDNHKASLVSLSEVLQVQAYMLFYIHKAPADAGVDNVKQQSEQVLDVMDEDGPPDAVGIPSLPKSKVRTEPEQTASHSASTVGNPAEGPTPSHAVAMTLPAASCCEVPVLEELPTGVENSDSNNLDPSGMRINYLPTAFEHRKTRTFATAGHGSTAQGAPQQEGRPDVFPMDPSIARPESLAGTTPLDDTTAPVLRKQLRRVQTSPIERLQPNRTESGAERQADGVDLPEHERQKMTKLRPLIDDLHTASLGNIIALVPVISDLMCHPVPPQVARRILRPQDDLCSLPGLDTITPAELASAIESSIAAPDTARCMKT